MCGIFGLIRNTQAAHPERATAVFVELGRLAVERGKDSAGFALTTPVAAPTFTTGPTYRHLDARETVIDNVHIVKDVCSFDDLWDDDKHLPLLAAQRVALGHTRWATQGKRDALTNASPLIVGSLVGTHNGDVDTATVSGKWSLPKPHGSTDTEVLYGALNRDRRDRRDITQILRKVEGRAALAWLDRYHPDRVYLARAALSPLSTAWDSEGNLYWASNPRWFRAIDAMFDNALGFHDITIVQEGVLLTVKVGDDAPVIEDMRRFTPSCRPSDARLSDAVIWRGFDASDRDVDKAQTRHKVASYVTGWTSNSSSGTQKHDKSHNKGQHKGKSRKTGGGFSGWDMSQPGYAAATVPSFDDLLDEVSVRQSTYPSSTEQSIHEVDADDRAADAGLWDDAELVLLDEDEAIAAADKWAEDGADAAILGVIRNASMPSEIEALMEEFDLSSPGAFHKFRDILQTFELLSTEV